MTCRFSTTPPPTWRCRFAPQSFPQFCSFPTWPSFPPWRWSTARACRRPGSSSCCWSKSSGSSGSLSPCGPPSSSCPPFANALSRRRKLRDKMRRSNTQWNCGTNSNFKKQTNLRLKLQQSFCKFVKCRICYRNSFFSREAFRKRAHFKAKVWLRSA